MTTKAKPTKAKPTKAKPQYVTKARFDRFAERLKNVEALAKDLEKRIGKRTKKIPPDVAGPDPDEEPVFAAQGDH